MSAVPRLDERLREHQLCQEWARLVGVDVARRARPRALAAGCLHVVVDNSPWLHELTLRAAELTARVRAGFPEVTSVRFTLGASGPAGPAPEPPRPTSRAARLDGAALTEIDAATAAIPDPALAAGARRLLERAWRAAGARGGAR